MSEDTSGPDESIERSAEAFSKALQGFVGQRAGDADTRELASKVFQEIVEHCAAKGRAAKIDVRPDPNTRDRLIITLYPPYTVNVEVETHVEKPPMSDIQAACWANTELWNSREDDLAFLAKVDEVLAREKTKQTED